MNGKTNGGAEAVVTIHKHIFNQETESIETFDVRPFITDPAVVRVSKGRTISIAPYETARVDVSISIPCYIPEIGETYQAAMVTIDNYLGDQVQQIINATTGNQEQDLNSL